MDEDNKIVISSKEIIRNDDEAEKYEEKCD